MILALQITALVSMIIITGIVIAGFVIFIGFCGQIKKQNSLLSQLIDTLKVKNDTAEDNNENIHSGEDESSITSNNITQIK